MLRASAVALVVALAASLGDVASCARPVAFVGRDGSSRGVGLLSVRKKDHHLDDVQRHQQLDADASTRNADLVTDLPEYGAPPTTQYSGFLDASASTPGTRLHYWFAAKETRGDDGRNSWLEAPTAVWFNGGPGSSSLLGFLQEQGPLLINATGGLMENPFSWTKYVNLLALESPAGVGWSYCEEMLAGGDCANDDISTASDATAALLDFFRKFPELRKNQLYLTGESYAGVYVPTLAQQIVDHNSDAEEDEKIPLVGIATGDPCTDNKSQENSMSMLWYGHKYGFVPENEYKLLWHHCGHRYMSPLTRREWTKTQASSTNLLKIFADEAKGSSKECLLAHRKFLWQTSNGFAQDWRFSWLNDLTLFGPAAMAEGGEFVPGTLDYMMTQWMMRDDVRKALHVESSPASAWPGPTEGWSYSKNWAACNEDASSSTPSMIDFYRKLAPKLERTIVFNGDTDPCVSYEGTREAIIKIGFDELEGGSQRPYFYNASGVDVGVLQSKPLLYGPNLAVIDAGPQFAGHVTDYVNNLSFVTVHGSGHMVPQFRPQVGLLIIKKLVTSESFAPPLPRNDALESMKEEDFEKSMEHWVIEAQATKYIDA